MCTFVYIDTNPSIFYIIFVVGGVEDELMGGWVKVKLSKGLALSPARIFWLGVIKFKHALNMQAPKLIKNGFIKMLNKIKAQLVFSTCEAQVKFQHLKPEAKF